MQEVVLLKNNLLAKSIKLSKLLYPMTPLGFCSTSSIQCEHLVLFGQHLPARSGCLRFKSAFF